MAIPGGDLDRPERDDSPSYRGPVVIAVISGLFLCIAIAAVGIDSRDNRLGMLGALFSLTCLGFSVGFASQAWRARRAELTKVQLNKEIKHLEEVHRSEIDNLLQSIKDHFTQTQKSVDDLTKAVRDTLSFLAKQQDRQSPANVRHGQFPAHGGRDGA